MKAAATFLADLTERGVILTVHEERLRYHALAGVLTPDDRALLVQYKPDLLMLLAAETAAAEHDEVFESETPLPLIDRDDRSPTLITAIPVSRGQDAMAVWLTAQRDRHATIGHHIDTWLQYRAVRQEARREAHRKKAEKQALAREEVLG